MARRSVRHAGTGSTGALTVLALLCPACVPAYAAFFSSLGLGFLVNAEVMKPLLLALLIVSVGALLADWRRHRSWLPLLSALVGGVLVYLFRYYYFRPEWITVGVGLLVFATTANYYKVRFAGVDPSCPVP